MKRYDDEGGRSAGEPLAEIEDLRVEVGGRVIVDGVGLRALPGRVTALVGASGSGKTTTGLALLGEFPAGARVTGRVQVAGGGPVGYVPQHPAAVLNPARRVSALLTDIARAQVRDLPRSARREAARERVLRALADAQLPDGERLLRRYPHQLSGGQQQRVVLAQALLLGARIVVADEPTTGQDALTKSRVVDQLAAVAARGFAVVLLSHDLDVVRALADEIHVMRNGRIVESGPARRVWLAPRHEWTRQLLGPRLSSSDTAGPDRRVDAREPDRPEDAREPDRRETPAGPDRPEDTMGPDRPTDTAEQDRPEDAGEPDHPEAAGMPDRRETPAGPDRPEDTAEPDHPEAAGMPDRRETPTGPDRPEDTAEPDHPEAAGMPDRRETPTGPDRPTDTAEQDHPEAAGMPDRRESPAGPDHPEDTVGPVRPEDAAVPVLRVRNLTARHRDGSRRGATVAVRAPELDLYAGQCLAVVGRSGSGKTTLARCLAGLHRDHDGEVLLDGAVLPRSLRDRRREQLAAVQYVFQDARAAFDEHRPVLSQVARTAVRLRGADSGVAEAEALTTLARLGLPAELVRRRPDRLSGGELQRAALARALLARPRVLLCDEITSGLDTVTRRGILDVLTGLLDGDDDLSLVLITHDLDTAAVAHRVAVLDDGQIVEQGPTQRILTTPRHPFTASLMATVAPRGRATPAGPGRRTDRDR